VAEPIEFTATVQDATLRPQLADEIIMAAEPVAFTATVQDVALRQNHVLKAGAISYSIAVQDVLTVAPGEFVTTPEAHGWSDQNTVEQNTAAFQAAIDDASANASHSLTGRGVVELVQNKTYTVVQNSNGSTSNQTACLTALSDVEIRTAGKPTRSSGNHAVIQWESWSGKTGMHNRVLLRGDDISNFLIGWVTLHGNKNTADVDEINYGTGQDGGLHNMVFYGGQNIQMKELISTHALADGIYMRALNGTITNWLVEDCTFTRNRRQGLSAIKGGVSGGGWDQIVWRRCEFSESGDMPGD